jgi:hypothetical protein
MEDLEDVFSQNSRTILDSVPKDSQIMERNSGYRQARKVDGMTTLVEKRAYTIGPRSSELERRRRCKSGSILKSAPDESTTSRFGERFQFTKRNASGQHGVVNLVDRRRYNSQSTTDDDAKAMILIGLDDQNDLVLYPQLGGLRQDPFDALPVASTGLVTDAFDYCKISDYGIQPCDNGSFLHFSRHSVRTICY